MKKVGVIGCGVIGNALKKAVLWVLDLLLMVGG